MKGRKALFVKINCAMKNKVQFTYDTTLAVDEISVVLIMRRDDGSSLIKDALYNPRIKCDLLSISQLLETGYKIHMKNKGIRIMDAYRVLVLKAHMDANRNLKV